MSDNITPFSGIVKIQSFDLTNDQVSEIKKIFQSLSAAKSLMTELENDSSKFVFDNLFEKYAQLKIEYDTWFEDLELHLKIETQSHQSWSIDFGTKTAQLSE